MGHKRCSKCDLSLPVTEFARDKQKVDGLYSSCKKCTRERAKKFQVANREKLRLEARRRWLARYGLTEESRKDMIEQQNRMCLICLDTPKTLHIDHCHKTGKVRGMLCGSCNRGIGLLNESEESLMRAIKYLRGDV